MKKLLVLALLLAPVALLALTLHGGGMAAARVRYWAASPFRTFWFEPSTPVPSWRATSATSTSSSTILDRSYLTSTGNGGYVTDIVWPYSINPLSRTLQTITATTSNPAVIVPDATDLTKWTYTGTGSATLSLISSNRTATTSVTMQTSSNYSTTVFTGYTSGSLAQHIANGIDSHLAGKTFASHATSLVSGNRQSGCWANFCDLSAMQSGGPSCRVTLVSPRHAVFATHYTGPSVGDTVWFTSMAGTLYTRTVTGKATITVTGYYYPDIGVVSFDSDLPSDVHYARVLPDNWAAKLPSIGNPNTYNIAAWPVPAIYLNRNFQACVFDVSSLNGSAYGSTRSTDGVKNWLNIIHDPSDAQRLAFDAGVQSGDSSSPVFFPVNGEMLLLGVLTFSNGDSTAIVSFKSQINALMSSLGGGYSLTEADLSGFTSY